MRRVLSDTALVDLVEFGADDRDALESWVAVERAAAAVDCPWEAPRTVHRQEMSVRHGFDGERGRYFLVRADGGVVGTVALFASDYDNLDLTWLEVVILPALRRRGHGRAALALALAEIRATGRTLVLLYGWESAAARAFGAANGFAEKSVEVRRIQELDGSAAQRAYVGELRAEAAAYAGEYDLVRIAGRTPDDLLPALVAVTAAINDAPFDDLEYEDEKYDVDRVRAYEQAQEESGYRLYRVIARHRGSGEVAGHTVVSVDAEQPAWGEQHDTAVVPAHRGHRLGLLLKAEMLLWLMDAEPLLRRILTENAASNAVMITVNERLGQRVVGRQLLLQRRL